MKGIVLDHTGKRFHRFTVLNKTEERYRKNVLWRVQCDCGAIALRPAYALNNGSAKSCGCYVSEAQRERVSKRPYESLYNSIGKGKTYEGKLSYEEFLEFVNEGKCHYCGDSVAWEEHRGKVGSGKYQLDRKDNSKGYTKDNCVVCCWFCNRMKFTHSYENFVAKVKQIAERLK